MAPHLSLRLVDQHGRPHDLTVAGAEPDTPLGELIAAAGFDPATSVDVDACRVAPSSTLAVAGVRQGSTVDLRAVGDRPRAAPEGGRGAEGRLLLVAVGGPDTGRAIELTDGRLVIGSSPALRGAIADPEIAPHHALVERIEHGTVAVSELGVGRPVEIDGRTTNGAIATLGSGQRLRIGSSSLLTEHSSGSNGRYPPAPGRWTGALVRGAAPERQPIMPVAALIEEPDPPVAGSATGFVSMGAAILTGVVAALVLRQPTLLVFSLVGAVGAGITSAVMAVRSRRLGAAHQRRRADEHRRFEAACAAQRDQAVSRLRRGPAWRCIGDAVVIDAPWVHRRADLDAWDVAVGHGSMDWTFVVEGDERGPTPGTTRLEDVELQLPLAPGAVVAVAGPARQAQGVVRSMLLQLVVGLGPADLRVIVITPCPERWEWATWLPHARDGGRLLVVDEPGVDGLIESIGPAGSGDERAAVVVVDGAGLLAARTAAARRLIERIQPWGTVMVETSGATLPALCTSRLSVNGHGRGELIVFRDPSGRSRLAVGIPHRLVASGATARTALAVSRFLAGLHDPESELGGCAVPDVVELVALLGPSASSATAIATRWALGGADPAPRALIGYAADGAVELDLDRDGPHALVAGTTGAGKSELLRSLVLALAAASPPEHLAFILVDYKGGSAFDGCVTLPHVAGLVTDLDDRLAARVLASLDAELRHRELLLRRVGAADLAAYRAIPGADPLARLVVIVDEFAALAVELPEFLHALVGVAQRGRSLGVNLVLATQRPAGVVNDDIRANTNLRIALRVQDPADSTDVIGDRAAAQLPRRNPGRAVLRLGGEELVPFQAAQCTGPAPQEGSGLVVTPYGSAGPSSRERAGRESSDLSLGVLVDRIVAAAAMRPGVAPRRPWTDPLPAVLVRPLAGGFGEVDLVAEQRRAPLAWDRATGHLLVVGAVGSGTTTALRRVALSLAHDLGPDRLHLYVLDGACTGDLAELGRLPQCAGVLSPADHDAVPRLITRLERLLDRSDRAVRSSGSEPVETVVVVDGASTVRALLSQPDQLDWCDRFDRLIADGPRAGIVFVFALDHPGGLPLAWSSRCAARWVGRLADPLDASSLGVPPRAAVVGGAPGRFVVGMRNDVPIDAQIAVSTDPAGDVELVRERWTGVTVGPVPVGPLPVRLEVAALGMPVAGVDGQRLRIPLGLGVLDGEPVVLDLHPGDHALVVGSGRSGRTTLLDLIEVQLGRFDEVIRVERLGGRSAQTQLTTVLDRLVGMSPDVSTVVLIDDAERIDDATGTVSRLLTEDRPGLHVIAAGRPEALRATGYGHWTGLVRRSRRGILLGAVQDIDADLLGVPVARRHLPRGAVAPGRGLMVADGSVEAFQAAISDRALAEVA